MTVCPLIVKRQIKGSSIWEQRNGTVTLSPFSLFCAECIRRKTRKREMFIFGLLTRAALRLPGAIIMPSRWDSGRGERGEWRTKNAERGRCHYYVYGVTNLVTEVTELVTGKESLTLLLKKLR